VQPVERTGRGTEHAFEGARNMEPAAETGTFGNLLGQRAGLLKSFGTRFVCHFLPAKFGVISVHAIQPGQN
jgi:hypothetical protein